MAIVCTNDLLCNKIGAEMISPEEYRKKYEGGERLSETDSLDRHIKQLEAENRKLRKAFNAAKAFIETNKDDPDMADIYDKYQIAEKALNR